MNNLLTILKENECLDCFSKRRGNLANLNLNEEALLIASSFNSCQQNIVIVKSNLYQAQNLYSLLVNLLNEEQVLLFLSDESLRVEQIASSPEIKGNRVDVMTKLCDDSFKIVVTHTSSLVRQITNKEIFNNHLINIKKNDNLDIKKLEKLLVECGYEHSYRVDQPLCYSKRGGIIDVFSINNEFPIRIEFFDSEVESIRYYDITTQRTIEVVDNVVICPATDLIFTDEDKDIIEKLVNDKKIKDEIKTDVTSFNKISNITDQELDLLRGNINNPVLYKYFCLKENNASIVDYLDDPLIYFTSNNEINNSFKMLQEETFEYFKELFEEAKSLFFTDLFFDLTKIKAKYDFIESNTFLQSKYQYTLDTSNVINFNNDLYLMKKIFDGHLAAKELIVVCVQNDNDLNNILDICKNFNYEIELNGLSINKINIYKQALTEGFKLNKENVVIYSSFELFNARVRSYRFANKFKDAEILNSYNDLNEHDYVVHEQYGVGQYLGIVTKEVKGIHKDYLHIVYKGNDSLYVPLEQFKLVRKFLSKEGMVPKLHKLGSNEWSKTKERIQNKVEDLAERLIDLYAKREQNIGFAFSKDTDQQIIFENEFEYELTKDQKIAVEEIKKDMESNKPMDRLLCGDVGFGKTEVAIRAAFKAIMDGKQVAYLCPTTILSRQHYQTFKNRFKNYAAEIRLINRFVIDSAQKEIIHDFNNHKIDIIIGTHRLLSKDFKFDNVGLLIIDEEQRFGVEHKEKIKELKAGIDVLSLSATPIPRTLQMSLIGIRQLSQLDTPPKNRMPVQTYVLEKNENVIKEIVERELGRNGQVFYLYNKVSDIYNVAAKLEQKVYGARVGVAHGKMNREQIEDVMLKFDNNDFNILVCTTIIETGIDIPNANTIIIEDADRFGLSQLYQIKGRVGRSDRLAYAYLLYSKDKQLSEIATKRLQSIKEFTQLGSGYKIAMRDLTIRGAGDILGPEQAGFIDTIGIDMYIELLREAINKKQDIKVEDKVEIAANNYNVDAYIPKQYIENDFDKIEMYKKVEKVTTLKQINDLEAEIKDIYGKLPKSVTLLLEKRRLDILLSDDIIENYKDGTNFVEITFTSNWSKNVDGIKLFEIINQISPSFNVRFTGGKIIIKTNKEKEYIYILLELLTQIKNI